MKLISLSSASALAVVLVGLGCGDSGATGSTSTGTTATGSTAQTATGAGTGSGSGSGSSSGAGGAFVCGGGGAGGAPDEAVCKTLNFDPNCGPCLAKACCDATKAANGNGEDPTVVQCAKACCVNECYPPNQSIFDFACGPTNTLPSNGSCLTLGGMVACNPMTNEGCNSAAGEACDRLSDTMGNNIGFKCYPAEINGMPQNIHEACQPCNDGLGYCKPGLSCFDACGKVCCTNADCAPGVCSYKDPNNMPIFPVTPSVGLCTNQ